MALLRFHHLVAAGTLAVGSVGFTLFAGLPASASSSVGSPSGAGDCFARIPTTSYEYQIGYAAGCSGHDEPELDPVSGLAGSARDLTWTAVLPTDGAVPVSTVGPTFWWGGTVTDPNPQSLFGQAFLEVQFYPDAIVDNCSTDGGFHVTLAPDKFSVCSPVWQVTTTSGKENAAFNAELYDGSSKQPLVMNGGDTIKIHFFVASASQGWNVNVSDLTTGQSGTIVLNSKYGPMLPAFGTQQIGNALGWGLVDDTPNSFVWEIGHTSDFTDPAGRLCVAGQTACDSYDTAHWLGFSPLQIKSVTFADGSGPSRWAAVSDLGGIAEVNATCPVYGGPFCTYPWYAFNKTDHGFTYGADYPGTQFDYGKAAQFATTPQCGGPFGPESTFCDTALSPVP